LGGEILPRLLSAEAWEKSFGGPELDHVSTLEPDAGTVVSRVIG
jgi:hypothetical protein